MVAPPISSTGVTSLLGTSVTVRPSYIYKLQYNIFYSYIQLQAGSNHLKNLIIWFIFLTSYIYLIITVHHLGLHTVVRVAHTH